MQGWHHLHLVTFLLEVLANEIGQGKKIKGIRTVQGEVKLSLCRWYLKNPKEAMRKLTQTIKNSVKNQDIQLTYKNQTLTDQKIKWNRKPYLQ